MGNEGTSTYVMKMTQRTNVIIHRKLLKEIDDRWMATSPGTGTRENLHELLRSVSSVHSFSLSTSPQLLPSNRKSVTDVPLVMDQSASGSDRRFSLIRFDSSPVSKTRFAHVYRIAKLMRSFLFTTNHRFSLALSIKSNQSNQSGFRQQNNRLSGFKSEQS